jgi:hypothetical protein
MSEPSLHSPAANQSATDTPSTQVKVSLPPRLYDRVAQQANQMGVSMAAYVRFAVLKHIEGLAQPQKRPGDTQLNDDFFWLAESTTMEYTTKK